MSRATRLATAATVLLVPLGSLTACGPARHPVPAPAPKTAATAPASADGPASDAPTAPSPAVSSARPAPGGTAGSGAGGGQAGGVPASAWMASRDLPLAASYHWQAPASSAQAAQNPRLEFEQLCLTTRDPSNDLADWKGPAAQAHVGTDDYADWQVQQTVVHFPGTDNGGAQMSFMLYQGLQTELNGCAKAKPGATVKVTTTGDHDLAATVTVPESGGGAYTLHEYVALAGRTVVELAVWSDHPSHPWSAPADATVLKAMEAPVCSSFKDC